MLAVIVVLGFLFTLTQGTARDDPLWATLISASTAVCFVCAILKLQARWLKK